MQNCLDNLWIIVLTVVFRTLKMMRLLTSIGPFGCCLELVLFSCVVLSTAFVFRSWLGIRALCGKLWEIMVGIVRMLIR